MTSANLGVIGVLIVSIILFWLFLKSTTIGIAFRATSEDLVGASVCGISIKKIGWLSWIISGGIIGCISGVIVAPIVFLNPELDKMGIMAFPAVVLGGFKSVVGALIGGMILGVAQLLAAGYMGDIFKTIFPWIALYVILIIRPEGLFGKYEKVRKI